MVGFILWGAVTEADRVRILLYSKRKSVGDQSGKKDLLLETQQNTWESELKG